MITTAEYLREKARAEAAEAKVAELEAELLQLNGETPQHEGNFEDKPESEDFSE